MRARDFFPLGIASGKAFCNRESETALLVDNIKNGKHSLLMAPRRYGKSSLCEHAIKLSKLPNVEVDFYMARNEKVIEEYIIAGVGELIGKALGPVDKLLNSIKQYVKNLQPKITVGTRHLSLTLEASAESDPASNIKEALFMLEQLLAEKKQQAVMLLDEFQNVGVIAEGYGIEGAIRHVAQKTKYLSVIFSGSNRKLLATMFEDDNRPLYKLCWKLTLDRIGEAHYIKHINQAAKYAWDETLDDEVIQLIMHLTERHPYYMNKLCDRLWTYAEKPPTMAMVEESWNEIVVEEKSDAVKEITALAPGQKTALFFVASMGARFMASKKVLLAAEMTSSSMAASLTALLEKDIIEKTETGYRTVNPVIKFYVRKDQTYKLT